MAVNISIGLSLEGCNLKSVSLLKLLIAVLGSQSN